MAIKLGDTEDIELLFYSEDSGVLSFDKLAKLDEDDEASNLFFRMDILHPDLQDMSEYSFEFKDYDDLASRYGDESDLFLFHGGHPIDVLDNHIHLEIHPEIVHFKWLGRIEHSGHKEAFAIRESVPLCGPMFCDDIKKDAAISIWNSVLGKDLDFEFKICTEKRFQGCFTLNTISSQRDLKFPI